jgi:catechol 2,3-dioxygenase
MSTPSLAIGQVTLTVHDLDRVSDFYQRVVGLHLLRADAASASLGVGERTLVELRLDKAARARTHREAGLFHTAFLLPSRGDLGRWLGHGARLRTPLQGASDHLVSEALYLADPEGNGIEIYSDRPRESWSWQDDQVRMATEPLDMENLYAAGAGGEWKGFPPGSTIGHVHLQVGALPPAEAFYAGTLGLDVTCRYPGGTFYAADGYHHHLATNIWGSRGAPVREMPSTGLTELQLLLSPERLAAQPAASLVDPWGTPIALAAI